MIANWSGYGFTVYPMNTNWYEVGGIYIFCGINPYNQWVALYIGQADSFHKRIPSHEQWNPAARLGATHIHAMVVPLAANRDKIEAELIRVYQPALNIQLK